MQLFVVGAGCHICMKRMKTLQREKNMFLPETVAHLCPFNSLLIFRAFYPIFPISPCCLVPYKQQLWSFPPPLLSSPLFPSTPLLCGAPLAVFHNLPRPSTSSSSFMTAAGSPINSRGVWCVCVDCCAEQMASRIPWVASLMYSHGAQSWLRLAAFD